MMKYLSTPATLVGVLPFPPAPPPFTPPHQSPPVLLEPMKLIRFWGRHIYFNYRNYPHNNNIHILTIK